VRSALGYGLDPQLLTLNSLSQPALGFLNAEGEGWQAQYLVDRAHNAVLDHLMTAGLIGAGLWLALVAAVIILGVSRARAAPSGEELAERLGCLGAVLAHVAEEQVGIATTAPLALFWLVAGVLVLPAWGVEGEAAIRPHARGRRGRWWTAAMVTTAVIAIAVGWIGTRWLLASVAYAEGTRRQIAGRTQEAYTQFQRSRALAPWLPLPAEAVAHTTIRLAGGETTPGRRLSLLHEGEAALAESRRHALGSGVSWTLTAQIAFAEARAGERGKLAVSLDAFEMAARLRPRDAQLVAQWAWAWLESGDPARARLAAEQAVALPNGRREWLAWAVLARAARQLGDDATAQAAADKARREAPPEIRRMLGGP